MSRKLLTEIIKKLPSYLFIVGSYARDKKNPTDLDLVSKNKKLKDVLDIFDKKFGVSDIQAFGKRQAFFTIPYKKKTIPVNVWFAEKKEVPIVLFNYLYPATFIKRVKHFFKIKGWKLGQIELRDDKQKLVHPKTYKEIFTILQTLGYKIPYRSPAEQEAKKK